VRSPDYVSSKEYVLHICLGISEHTMQRRDFLAAAASTGAALVLPHSGDAQPSDARPVQRQQRSSLWLDAQGGVSGLDEKPDGRYVATPQLVEAVRQRRLDVVNVTVADPGNAPDRFRSAVEGIAIWNRIINDNRAIFARVQSVADVHAARAAGKLGVIYDFQDTAPLEGDASRVATFAALGVKVVQLTYNKRNLCGDGCLERDNAGLSDFGRETIAKINDAKVVLDLSHSGQKTVAEGIVASKAPMAITHSGCRALTDNPRNTFDAEMRALANKGGVFGLYLLPFLTAKGQPQREDLIRHIEHAANVCGEDHIGIGTDNPMLGFEINDQSRKEQREFFENRAKRGIAAPGEAADVFNMVEGYNDALRYEHLASDLSRRGWSSARIDKLLGGNFLRLFGEVWQADG
jgi:membrane dipeptidase